MLQDTCVFSSSVSHSLCGQSSLGWTHKKVATENMSTQNFWLDEKGVTRWNAMFKSNNQTITGSWGFLLARIEVGAPLAIHIPFCTIPPTFSSCKSGEEFKTFNYYFCYYGIYIVKLQFLTISLRANQVWYWCFSEVQHLILKLQHKF